MLLATQGIVLGHVKYSESSIICKIYTETAGIKSYIINNIRSKKSQGKMAVYQPLTLLNLIVYNKENKNLQRIKEVHCAEPLKSIPYNIYKSSMALFIAEVLHKTIKEEEANPALFAFIKHFIKLLDTSEDKFSDFHLIFIMHLTQYLGFSPKADAKDNSYFDMIEGKFCMHKPLHSFFIAQPLCAYFHKLLAADYDNVDNIKLNGRLRLLLLEKLLLYYKTHLDGMAPIKSVEIFKSVFE